MRLLAAFVAIFNQCRATIRLDIAAEVYLENSNGECVIAVPMLTGVGKLATAKAQADIIAKIQQSKQQAATMCIYPLEPVASANDALFKKTVKEAVLSKSVKPGMLMLDCLGEGGKIIVTYFWKSQYTGSMTSGIPALPIYEQGSFVVKGSLLDKLRKKFTWNSQPKGPTLPLINAYKDESNPPKASVEAYAYCRELFAMKEAILVHIRTSNFPLSTDVKGID